MPVWAWVGVGLIIAVGLFSYRQLIWIPNHSSLDQLDELPYLRETVEQFADSEFVHLIEEEWRFVLFISPPSGRRPRERLRSELRPDRGGYWLIRGKEREGEVVRWEVTVSKKASEWMAAGFNEAGEEIVEHRFGSNAPRSNWWANSVEQLDQTAREMSFDIEEWVGWLSDPDIQSETP